MIFNNSLTISQYNPNQTCCENSGQTNTADCGNSIFSELEQNTNSIKKSTNSDFQKFYTDLDEENEDFNIHVEENKTGCIVTAIGSQSIYSEPLQEISLTDIDIDGYSTTAQGSDDIIKGAFNQALSTQNVHNCACLILYNDKEQLQLLYHVFAGTQNASIISDVLEQVMPEGFNRAVIIPGDNALTELTVDIIYEALTNNYPDTDISFMHTTIEKPAIVSYNGQIYQAQSPAEGTLLPVGVNLNPNEAPYSLDTGEEINAQKVGRSALLN